MLLSDDEHNQVQNLTHSDVDRLDLVAKKLKLDSYVWLYVGRSRLNDETASQIKCKFFGKNVSTSGMTSAHDINPDII